MASGYCGECDSIVYYYFKSESNYKSLLKKNRF